jgi:restriction system protein
MVTNYYRVMLGKSSQYASECFEGGFIGADFGITGDLEFKLPDEWRAFNKEFIPVVMATNPAKTKIGAGLSCGQLWTISKGIAIGDIVLCPDGSGVYRVGRVLSSYYYVDGQMLPHRRKVEWIATFPRASMSESLQSSTRTGGTVSNATGYADEIEELMGNPSPSTRPTVVVSDPDVEDPSAFALESHLEDFLVKNWLQTPLGKDFNIYSEEGEIIGQQYPTDAGIIDILAVSRDGKRLLIIELKRGRASDVVVGQTLRYMGFVSEQLASAEQTVEGIIIGLEDDPKLRWAIAPVPAIKFYRYRIDFQLLPS